MSSENGTVDGHVRETMYLVMYIQVKVVGDDQSHWWNLPYPRTLDSFWDSTDDSIIDDTSEQKSVTVRTRQSGETTVSEISCLQNKQGIQRSVDDPSIVSLPATKDIGELIGNFTLKSPHLQQICFTISEL